jgi:putative FmdB family regulatory protein
MPTYEYACTHCGQHIEVVQSMSDAPLAECGACGGRLRKVFSPIGIVFKGSGFYRTDSRGKSGAAAGNGTKSGEAKEAKPAAPATSEGAGKSDSPAASRPAASSKPAEKSA